MDIVAATAKYEAWLEQRIPIIKDDLDHKHELMARGAVPFPAGHVLSLGPNLSRGLPEGSGRAGLLGVGTCMSRISELGAMWKGG